MPLRGLGDVYASPVVSAARTATIADEWAAATAPVDLPACASCARRPIYDEAGYPVNFVPVADLGGLLGDASMAALTLSPKAVREYEVLPPRLAVAAPVASVPELGPGLFHLYPSMLQRGRRAARGGDDGGGGAERGEWRAAKPLEARCSLSRASSTRVAARVLPL